MFTLKFSDHNGYDGSTEFVSLIKALEHYELGKSWFKRLALYDGNGLPIRTWKKNKYQDK